MEVNVIPEVTKYNITQNSVTKKVCRMYIICVTHKRDKL